MQTPFPRDEAAATVSSTLGTLSRMRFPLCRLAALALAALAATYVLVPETRVRNSVQRRRHQTLTALLHVTDEPSAVDEPPAATLAAARRHSQATVPTAAAVIEYGGTAPAKPSGAAPCCAFWPPRQHNVSLAWPVIMERPITVLMKAGNLDGRFACDVPCRYVTHAPADGSVDVVVGEAARPLVPEQVRLSSACCSTAHIRVPVQPWTSAARPQRSLVRGRCGRPTRAC